MQAMLHDADQECGLRSGQLSIGTPKETRWPVNPSYCWYVRRAHV